jgi:hypothetical protein
MKVLIACEESQTVCKEFRKLGHEAYSCDIQDCSGGHPEWHIKGDVIPLLKEKWDLIIAHPPCTYLSNAGAVHLYGKKYNGWNNKRYQDGLKAKDFFMLFYNADCPKIAIENPVPSIVYNLPPYTQIIQPYEYGDPVTKKTCLWLKGLNPLLPLLHANYCYPKTTTREAGNWFNKGGKDRAKNRSKTFQGIAEAMALQWGGLNETSTYN